VLLLLLLLLLVVGLPVGSGEIWMEGREGSSLRFCVGLNRGVEKSLVSNSSPFASVMQQAVPTVFKDEGE
jgi:hypothetical protein